MDLQPTDHFATDLEVCYEVKLYLAGRMQKLAAEAILEFVSSDPNAAQEIEEWVFLRGHHLLKSEPLPDGSTRFLIQKKG